MNRVVKTTIDINPTWDPHTDYVMFQRMHVEYVEMYEKMSKSELFTRKELDLIEKEVHATNIGMVISEMCISDISDVSGSVEVRIIDGFKKLASLRAILPAPSDTIKDRMECIQHLQTSDPKRFNDRTIDCNTRDVDLIAINNYIVRSKRI